VATKDPVKRKAAKLRYRSKRHAEKFGEGAGDMRGKHGNQAKGSANGRWNSGRMLSDEGYVLVRVGKNHPLAFGGGYAYEHLVVWMAAGRRAPLSDELIHHANEDKTDNRIENLELKTRQEHGLLHIAHRDRDHFGRLIPLDGREWSEFPEAAS
jgi:hypothetical protein